MFDLLSLPPDIRENHLALSLEDLEYRELALRDEEALRRSTFQVLEGDPRLAYRQQPWPTFVSASTIDEIKNASLALATLIRRVPQKILKDPHNIAAFYRMPSRAMTEIILSEPNGIEDSVARGDLIHTANGFKCIEFNYTPKLGGWETTLLASLHARVPITERFFRSRRLRPSYTPTLQVLFLQMLRQADRLGICDRREFNVGCALEFDPDSPEAIEFLQSELDEVLREADGGWRGKAIAAKYSRFVPIQKQVFFGLTRVHALLELSSVLNSPALYRCFKAKQLLLFNGPVGAMLSDKRNLALLYENRNSDVLSPAERETVGRYIPWTYRVVDQKVHYEEAEADLTNLLFSARDRLVLKEGSSYGGKGVFIGKVTSEARWDELVRQALASGGWVVQERLESSSYLFQCGDFGCAPHDVIWGPFVFGDTYGGVILRVQPKEMGGAVNLSLAATEGIVFEV